MLPSRRTTEIACLHPLCGSSEVSESHLTRGTLPLSVPYVAGSFSDLICWAHHNYHIYFSYQVSLTVVPTAAISHFIHLIMTYLFYPQTAPGELKVPSENMTTNEIESISRVDTRVKGRAEVNNKRGEVERGAF